MSLAEIEALRMRVAELEHIVTEHTALDETAFGGVQRYRKLFETGRDGIVLVTADTGQIIDLNPAFLSVSGYSREELMGKKLAQIDLFQNTDAIMVIFKELRTHDYIYYDDLPLETKKGTRVPVEIVGTAHSTGGEKVLQYTVRDISRRKAIEEELWKAESRFRALFEKAAIGIAIIDAGGTIIESNHALERMLGFSEKEMAGKHFTEFTHTEDREKDATWFEELLAQKRDNIQMAIRCLKKDGAVVWGLLAVSLIRNSKNEPLYAIRMIEDITDRKRAEESVISSRNFYLSLIDELPNPIRRTDTDGQSDYFNRAWLEFTGRAVNQELGNAWTGGIHPEDLERFVQIQSGCFKTRAPYVTEYRLRSHTGEYHWLVEFGRPFAEIEGGFGGYISSCYDVQERKTFEETLSSLSTTDELTGLLNRRGFFSLAQQQLKVANRTGTGFLLLYVDLDGLKKINDTQGHAEGDLALVETASILREIFRESDILGRLGGDEFVVLALERAGDKDEEAAIIRRLQESIKARNTQPERHYQLSISAGVHTYDPKTLLTLDQIISRTDALMYEEKKAKYRALNRGV